MKIKPAAAILVAITLLTACHITPDRAEAICPQVHRISDRAATRVLLKNNNETTRLAFDTAAASLEQASKDETLSFDDLVELLVELKFDRLHTEDATLIIDAATLGIILLFPDGAEVDVSEHESARTIAGCIAAGIRSALD